MKTTHYALFLIAALLLAACGNPEKKDEPVARIDSYVYSFPEVGHVMTFNGLRSTAFEELAWRVELPGYENADTFNSHMEILPTVPGTYIIHLFAIGSDSYDEAVQTFDVKPACFYEGGTPDENGHCVQS
jgi:hypothetical protein